MGIMACRSFIKQLHKQARLPLYTQKNLLSGCEGDLGHVL